jgi:hypothetical protein
VAFARCCTTCRQQVAQARHHAHADHHHKAHQKPSVDRLARMSVADQAIVDEGLVVGDHQRQLAAKHAANVDLVAHQPRSPATVRIFKEEIAARAQVWTINGFAAHADQPSLLV